MLRCMVTLRLLSTCCSAPSTGDWAKGVCERDGGGGVDDNSSICFGCFFQDGGMTGLKAVCMEYLGSLGPNLTPAVLCCDWMLLWRCRFVNKRNLSGFSALHYAVWSCRPGVVSPLLASGADICAVNDRVFDAWVPVPIGSTPLHLAVMRASTPVAMLLLQHYVLLLRHAPRDRPRPSDPRTIVNLYGMNPAQLAAHRNNRQLAQLLMPTVPLSRVLAVHATPQVRCVCVFVCWEGLVASG